MSLKDILARLLIAWSFLLTGIQLNAQTVNVIVPDVPAPFNKVFEEIFEGIQEGSQRQANNISLGPNTDSEAILNRLQETSNIPVIALGNTAKKALSPFEDQLKVVYGATFSTPKNSSNKVDSISLIADPDQTFAWLKTLSPSTKTIHVVYQQEYSGWLIELAEDAAKKHGFDLKKYASNDVRQAANVFRTILADNDPDTNSIWLLQRDPSLDEKAVLPDILKQAWDRDFPVFSNNPAHVPRGALFALYPDNKKMGESLAKLALNPKTEGVLPLNDLLIAINVRTASHLGKNFSRQELKQFNLVFPNR